ncbi:MAG: outer membrane protein assembly factor BamB family protein, partial [Limisphaerales bacterium]
MFFRITFFLGEFMPLRGKLGLTAHASICTTLILLFNLAARGEPEEPNWNQFRGPNGQGVAPAGRIPVRFGPEENVLWKTVVPSGHSSPVIWNDHIFLTASEPTNTKELMTLAIGRGAGRILWRQVIHAETQASLHPLNHPASSTPAADANHVYVYFGTYGLLCYDHAGKQVWQRRIATPESKYGMATSPILYKDTVILVLDGDNGSSRLLAVHRDTGETVWEQPRSLFKANWSTPMIFRHGAVDELVVLGSKRLTAYQPSTGEEIWWAALVLNHEGTVTVLERAQKGARRPAARRNSWGLRMVPNRERSL